MLTEVNSNPLRRCPLAMTITEVCDQFKQRELTKDKIWRSHSTKKTYEVYLNRWIIPHWGTLRLSEVRTMEVESSLRRLPLAKSSCAKIRNQLSVLFNHACRHELFDRNPIRLVRQGAKRRTTPSVLTPAEIKALLSGLGLRERTLVLLAASTGLRQSELFGVKWCDIDSAQHTMSVCAPSCTEWSGLAKLNHHRSLYLFIQLFWRHSTNGEQSAATTNWATGCLQVAGIVAGSQFGARRSRANIFVLPRRALAFRRNSDGIPSGTRIQLCCGASEQSSK